MIKPFLPFLLAAFLTTFALFTTVAQESGSPCREKTCFNDHWLFQKGDSADNTNNLNYYKNPEVKAAVIASSTNGLTEDQRSLGAKTPFTQPGFDDSSWRKLNLPHDWAVEGPFDIKLPGETGKLPYVGVGWYRKHLTLPASDQGKQISLEIDGAMSHSLVWCNGQFVGGWPYGYSSYHLDLTPYLKFGSDNEISIRLENPADMSRWYPGAGIYRNVWLSKTSPVHVEHWGTFITTPKVDEKEASVNLKVTTVNQTDKAASVSIATDILDQGEKITSFAPQSITIPAGGRGVAESTTQVANPKLWDTSHPNLYTAVTTVTQDGKIVDRYETPFGIRTIQFTADNGFLLNG